MSYNNVKLSALLSVLVCMTAVTPGASAGGHNGLAPSDAAMYEACVYDRENMPPVALEGRTLFYNCTFSDVCDAVYGNCVFLNCRFEMDRDLVLGTLTGRGAVFMNCDFISRGDDRHLFIIGDEGSQVALVDCRFEGGIRDVHWNTLYMSASGCYQSGVTLNGADYVIRCERAFPVEMDGMALLDAYKFSYAGRDYYNVLNLLSGYDGWDPLGMADTVRMAEAYSSRQLTGLPVFLSMVLSDTDLEENGTVDAVLSARTLTGGFIIPDFAGWEVSDESVAVIPLDRDRCSLALTVPQDSICNVTVGAVMESGLEISADLRLMPCDTAPQAFSERPYIHRSGKGYYVKCSSAQDEGRNVRVYWYTADDAGGRYGMRAAGRLPISQAYRASADDVGRYLVARVDVGSRSGRYWTTAVAVYERPLRKRDIRR